MKKIILSITLIYCFTLSSNAQDNFDLQQDITASATVVAPLAIASTVDLAFGQVATDADGTVVMTAAASPDVSTTGGASALIVTDGFPRTAGKIAITGLADAKFNLTFSSTVELVKGSATYAATPALEKMEITAVSSSEDGAASEIAMGSGGTKDIYFGGTLNITTEQVTGSYSGTFTVTISYN